MNSVPDEHQYDIMLGLKNLCVKYSNKIIMGHLDVKSIKNKFELLSSLIGDNIDILMMSETKRSSRTNVFSKKKGILRNFAKFVGKHLCFPMNFAKFLRTPFLTEHLR